MTDTTAITCAQCGHPQDVPVDGQLRDETVMWCIQVLLNAGRTAAARDLAFTHQQRRINEQRT